MKHQNHTGHHIPRNIQTEFEETHIRLVWEELSERFGFPLPVWKKRFAEYLEKQSREVTGAEAFYTFGFHELNPILNKILARREGHPTWNSLCQYVLNKGR